MATDDLLEDAGRALSNMALTVLTSEAAITRFRECLVREVMRFTVPASGILEDHRFRAAVFPLAVRDGEVTDEVNPIWANPAFILPMVVSLAQLYDAILSSDGKPCFFGQLENDPQAIYGLRIATIQAGSNFQRERFVTMVAGAAKAYLTDIDQCHLARWAISEYRHDATTSRERGRSQLPLDRTTARED